MELTIQEYSQTAAALNDLRDRYANVVFPVETTAGMKDASQARKELRDIRVGLEKMRKEIKAPALERCRLIDEEAKAITSALRELEDPIDEQIKAEEARREREKQERERIERERVAAIRAKLERIVSLPSECMNDDADTLEIEIAHLRMFEPGEDFAEFAEEATNARDKSLAALEAIHARRVEQDREAARLEAERAELERLKAEAAERQRIEDERRQAEQAKIDAERAEVEAKLAAERAEIEAQRAELEKQKADAIRAEQELQESIERAERERAERERMERERQEAQAEIARIEAERDVLNSEPLQNEVATHGVTDGPFVFDSNTSSPDVSIIVEIIAGHFGCSDDEAKDIIAMAAAEIISQRSEAA